MPFYRTCFTRFLLLVLPALLAAGCSQPSALPPLGKDAIVLAFGDSLTAGTGASVGYPQRLEKIIGRAVINAGVPGETSGGAKRRLSGLLNRHQPQLLIVCTGGNDFLRRHDRAETENNLREIVAVARRAAVPVVLIAVPRISPLPLNHPIYKTVADDYDLWLEDDILKTVLHDNTLKSDRVHPNDAGYQQIAEAVAALLTHAGAV